MILETLYVLAVLGGGAATLRLLGARGWGLVPLGWLVGTGLVVAVGFVQLLTPLPTSPTLTLAATALGPALLWLLAARGGRDLTITVWPVAVTLAAVPLGVWLFRSLHLVKYHIDTADYLTAAGMIANGTYADGTVPLLLSKRLVGFPLLEAPARLTGELYVASAMPLLALATLGALAWIVRHGAGKANRAGAGFAALGVLLLVSTNRFVFHAFYLNGHLLMAANMLILVGVGWLRQRQTALPRQALLCLQVLSIVVLVLTRREGPILALLGVLPTLLDASVGRRHRNMLLLALGGTTTAYYGWAQVLLESRGFGSPVSIPAFLGLGALVLVAAILPVWDRLAARSQEWLLASELVLWLLLGALAVSDLDRFVRNIDVQRQNLFEGVGFWGPGFAVLVVLIGAALLLVATPHGRALTFPLTSFVPVAFLSTYVRSGFIARADDSLVRVIIQLVPVAVVYVAVAGALGRWRVPLRIRGASEGMASS